MPDRFIVLAAIPQALGQAGAGAHVGTGFKDSPEVARVAPECLFAQRALAGRDALGVEFEGAIGLPGRLGQDHISVGAIGGDAQRLPGSRDGVAPIDRFPGVVDEFLGLIQQLFRGLVGSRRFRFGSASQLPRESKHNRIEPLYQGSPFFAWAA